MALAEVGACGRLLLWPRVVLFGDSITEFSFQENGWGASLAERLVRKCDVVNRGLSGYNTRWAKLILPRLISKSTGAESTVAVTIFFGANDSALKDLNPKQHVPLEEYAANLKSMIQYLKSVDITEDRIILITPPPLQESAWEKECLAKDDYHKEVLNVGCHPGSGRRQIKSPQCHHWGICPGLCSGCSGLWNGRT
ncbi:isoamyl acetate-hydrolyzing esterase 1 homolog isoform X4 [Grus americana]|uniref:isoamyl acetate-hydrolyzing esterase 1 homolog isoform X4 n=1 Tax=Grus americana TaxID=9117 RepID=UPI00240779E5|nr:isoamyl acetate-hydrolyzing esterase 1 homolog isoform X4 [Grus americana]